MKELIINKQLDPNAPHTTYQTKPLEFALQSGSLETLRYLIEEVGVNLEQSFKEKIIIGQYKTIRIFLPTFLPMKFIYRERTNLG